MQLSFRDLAHLAAALATAVDVDLMSREEARAIWKRYLIKMGLKAVPSRGEGAIGETKPKPSKATTSTSKKKK